MLLSLVGSLTICSKVKSCIMSKKVSFEKVDGAYCFWSVHAWVRGCVTHFVPSVTFKPLKLES